jgi:hypothetical protein
MAGFTPPSQSFDRPQSIMVADFFGNPTCFGNPTSWGMKTEQIADLREYALSHFNSAKS